MKTELNYIVKMTHGTKRVYPYCELSKKLAAFARVKTFTGHMIKELKAMGFTFKQYNEEEDLNNIR